MTTQVVVNACCTGDKEVLVRVIGHPFGLPDAVLQNGERYECSVYDRMQVQVEERYKSELQPEAKPE